MAEPGGDLLQGNENEIPQLEAGVRDNESGRLEYQVPSEQDVDVDRPRALGYREPPLHLGLDGFRQAQELRRVELRANLENLVQEPGLVRVIHGLGLVDGRGGKHFDSAALEKPAGPGQVRRSSSQIAAEAEVIDHEGPADPILANSVGRAIRTPAPAPVPPL